MGYVKQKFMVVKMKRILGLGLAAFLAVYVGSYSLFRVTGVLVHRTPSVLDYDASGQFHGKYHTVGVGPLHPDPGVVVRFGLAGNIFRPLCRIEAQFREYTQGDRS